MPDIVTLPGRVFILGEKKTVGLKNIRSETGASVASTLGTITIYDSSGSTTLAETNITVAYNSTNTRAKATYALSTGAGQTITTAGTYRMVFELTFSDGSIYLFQQELIIKSKPF